MRSKKVWRYWCDHCNKGGCNKSAMSIHEKHCTMNPNRYCRMCKSDNTNLLKAVELLPDPNDFEKEESHSWGISYKVYPGMEEALDKIFPEVRRILDNCPVCILSALRQKGKGKLFTMNFDYQKEVKQYWEEVEHEGEGYY